MSVLGETVLVCYIDALVTYHRDSLEVAQVLKTLWGLWRIVSTTADSMTSSFLITTMDNSVYVLNDEGNLRHKIDLKEKCMDCAVVESELWVGYDRGHISVMTSQ